MRKPFVFMFSGQGSHHYNMGKELFTHHSTFRKWMLQIDDLVYRTIGKSVVAEIYNDQKRIDEKFDRTLLTHPAIFMVEYSLLQVFLEMGIKPDFVLGASLGEFTAAAASGIMGVEDIIDCIIKQAGIFESSCKIGSMLAVVDNPKLYHETPFLFQNSELAAINYHSHFVVSGEAEKLNQIKDYLNAKNITCQLLAVSYGFHSSFIDPAEKIYQKFLETKTFNKPLVSFVSCLLGKSLTEIPNNYFWEIVRNPILFQQAIQELEKQEECIYFDLGPSGTMANFTKQNLTNDPKMRCFSIMTQFNQELKSIETIKKLFL